MMGYYGLLLLFTGVTVIAVIYAQQSIYTWKVQLLFINIMAIFLCLFFTIHHHFEKSCEILIDGSAEQLVQAINQWPIAAPLVSILLMTMQAVLAPLPAFLITAANGLLFGIFWGVIISLIGAMSGALASFIISRWFYRHYAYRLLKNNKWLTMIENISASQGFKIVLIARLLPFVSFDLVSYAAGLGKMRMASFLLATLLGMIPATIVYTAVGSSMMKLEQYSSSLVIYSTGIVLVVLIFWLVRSKFV